MKIALFSSGSLSLPLIPFLTKISSEILVITKPPKPQGRGMKIKPNPVDELASKLGLKIIYSNSLKKDLINQKYIKEYLSTIDIAISCDIGLIIPEELINLPKLFINIHPSLLPLYRGPSPIQYTLLNGETLTGITICLLSKDVDKGDIILQRIMKIQKDDNYLTLKEKLSTLALETFKKFLEIYQRQEINYFKQDETKASYTQKIKDTFLDLSKGTNFVHNQVRAFYPEAYLFVNLKNKRKRVKILKTQILEELEEDFQNIKKINTQEIFIVYKKRLFFNPLLINPNEKKILEILELQVESKKLLNAQSFINGYL